MVGAGVLGLPSAMVFLGWTGGTITLVFSWFISVGGIDLGSCMSAHCSSHGHERGFIVIVVCLILHLPLLQGLTRT